MDYNQFIPKNADGCDCSNHIRGTIILFLMVSLVIDCVTSCSRARKVYRLEHENNTLKEIILKTVDKTLVRMMKNGNNIENDLNE